jgi:adenine-specific DNA-methyltransferase
MQGEISNDLASLFGMSAPPLETPKSTTMLKDFVAWFTEPGDMIFDFFAGSGTTGHAVMELNARSGSSRRFGLVQFPEPCAEDSVAQKAGYNTISEICKKRLELTAKAIQVDLPEAEFDSGFRVFKLDRSNIRAWNPNPADLEASLLYHQDHLVEGRTESDILFELLLKLGLDLCVPIAQKVGAGDTAHTVYSVGGGVLMACLSPSISRADVEALAQGIIAWRKALGPAGDTTCVFRDSAFADDVAKTNLAAILAQAGIANVRSL